MTTQPRTLGGMVPNGAPSIGQAIRVKTTAPFTTEWFTATAALVTSVAGRIGDVVLTHNDITDWNASLLSYAPLANPNFTGLPGAPTAAPGTNTPQLATTAFVSAAVAAATAGVSSWNARTGAVILAFSDITAVFAAGSATPAMNGTGTAGSANTWSRSDHVHPSDTSKLSLSGGAMSGPITLAADPTLALHAATKQYADTSNIDMGTY
jgi:hypothetical protein